MHWVLWVAIRTRRHHGHLESENQDAKCSVVPDEIVPHKEVPHSAVLHILLLRDPDCLPSPVKIQALRHDFTLCNLITILFNHLLCPLLPLIPTVVQPHSTCQSPDMPCPSHSYALFSCGLLWDASQLSHTFIKTNLNIYQIPTMSKC
jgi:hypothetical protein